MEDKSVLVLFLAKARAKILSILAFIRQDGCFEGVWVTLFLKILKDDSVLCMKASTVCQSDDKETARQKKTST